MPNNQNNQQRNKTPRIEIVPYPGELKTLPNGDFSIEVEARVLINKRAFSDDVIFKLGTTKLGSVKTDSSGTCIFVCNIPQRYAGQSIVIRIHLASRVEEASVTVSLPEAKKEASNSLDPDRITVMNWVLSNAGLCSMNIRVVGNHGEALKKTRVNLVFEGKNHCATTNNLGHAYWEVPRLINCNEKVEVFATVDGIKDHCKIKIWNAPEPSTSFSAHAFFSRVSFLILAVTSIISLFLFLAGFFGLIMASLKSPVERLTSESSSGGMGSLILIMLSLIPPSLLVANSLYYWLATKLIMINERRNYRNNRFSQSHSKDPFVENIMEYVKDAKKDKEHNHASNGSGSIQQVAVAKTSNFVSQFMEAVAAEGIVHTIIMLFRKLK